jgi:hypothetical protein
MVFRPPTPPQGRFSIVHSIGRGDLNGEATSSNIIAEYTLRFSASV